MIAALVAVLDTALEPRRAAYEQGYRTEALAVIQALELGTGGAPETVRPVGVTIAKHVHGKMLGGGEGRVAERLSPDAPEHQRRIQRYAVEAAGSHADRLAHRGPGGYHGDPGGEVAQGLTENAGINHERPPSEHHAVAERQPVLPHVGRRHRIRPLAVTLDDVLEAARIGEGQLVATGQPVARTEGNVLMVRRWRQQAEVAVTAVQQLVGIVVPRTQCQLPGRAPGQAQPVDSLVAPAKAGAVAVSGRTGRAADAGIAEGVHFTPEDALDIRRQRPVAVLV